MFCVDFLGFESFRFVPTEEYTVIRQQDAEERESQIDGIASQTAL
jgi:hypothetical protein